MSQTTSFEELWKCHCLNLSKICLRPCPAPSKCLSEKINWIISRIPRWIWKILFVLSLYEFLAMLEGKIRKGPFFRVQFDEMPDWVRFEIPIQNGFRYILSGLKMISLKELKGLKSILEMYFCVPDFSRYELCYLLT